MPLSTQPAGYPAGLTVCQMTMSERLVVLSFRLWALPIACPQQVHVDWRAGFRALGLEHTALAIFNPLLEAIFSASCRVMEVHKLECCGASKDESLFLRCISLFQHERVGEAESILMDWLPPAGARVAASLASRLAAAMDAAQLPLPLHEMDSDVGKTLATGSSQRGLSLLH